MAVRMDLGLRTVVMVLVLRPEVAGDLACLSSRRAPLISTVAIAVVVEGTRPRRRMSSGTQLRSRLGVILNQRPSMGLVGRTEVVSMERVEGGFPGRKVRSPWRDSW